MPAKSPLSPSAPQSSAPPDMVLYAIGDIHGCASQLKNLLTLIEEDAEKLTEQDKTIVFLGDYIDRGPDSKGVIETLISGIPAEFKAVYLRGNHEEALMRFLDGDMELGRNWLSFGGMAAVMSYGITPPLAVTDDLMENLRQALSKAIPQNHKDFLAATSSFYDAGDYHFVHAGIRPGIPLNQQSDQDRWSIRAEFLNCPKQHPKMIVHGHSISWEPDMKPNRIGVDTGAFATGRLTALVLHGTTQRFLST